MSDSVESSNTNVSDYYGPDERDGDEFIDSDDVDNSKEIMAPPSVEVVDSNTRQTDERKTHIGIFRHIEEMRELAISRGGKCLSSFSTDRNTNLEWECCDGHTWFATVRNVVHNKSWCPKCHINVGEELTRATFVECFPGKTFERIRPEWLDKLELDGYNSELKLAFEYQGIQHFKHVPHFHRIPGQFEAQLARDARKRECCAHMGITLLEIPYKIKLDNIRTEVRKMLSDLGLEIADIVMSNNEFYNTCRSSSHDKARLELVRNIAIKKGGVCLAEKCIRNDIKIDFKCGFGHEFKASLQDINQDISRGPRFCPTCGGTQKKNSDVIRARVDAIGYKLINVETKLVGGRNRCYLTVQCPANHPLYGVIMDNLISGDGKLKKGCNECGHARTGKSKHVDLNKWSEETGIVSIGKYNGRNKDNQWKCRRNHVFTTRLDSMQSKILPCSACWLVNYAAARNFEILSEIPDNVGKGYDIKWRCLKCKQFEIEASRVSVSKKDLVCKVCK